ncbi:hypothetical protein C8Q77DRAFT_709100 [Trametes polyzona]|nr:hypothetical protein C8Q77DRAFT_709100 [Trametes polyzona]
MANTHTDNTANRDASASGGTNGSHHQKLRGAAEVIHGIGDNLRGRAMSAVDSKTNAQSGTHPEVEKGRREVEEGMAKLTGGPGVNDAPPQHGVHHAATDGRTTSASTPLAQQGNTLGPASGITAGFNAGQETALAEAPYQPQHAPSGAGPEGAPSVQQGSNDRDFHPGSAGESAPQQGTTPGPAPDRSMLSKGDPQRLG